MYPEWMIAEEFLLMEENQSMAQALYFIEKERQLAHSMHEDFRDWIIVGDRKAQLGHLV